MLRVSFGSRPGSRSTSLLPTIRSTLLALIGLALLLFITIASAAPEAIPDRNPLNIEWGPAPAPEDGPPLSRSASRDKSLLGAQVGAIVGAWVFFVLVLGGYLQFIGRRLRADALRGRASLDIEMVKPTLSSRNFDPSPITPGTNSASPSKAGMPNFSWPSPTKQNFPTFDERVIQHDKEQREREMEQLYAAVMEHDASSNRNSNSTTKQDRLSPKDVVKGGSLPRLKSPKLLRALTSPTFPSLKSTPAPKSPGQKEHQESKTPSPEKSKSSSHHHRNRSSSFSSSSPSKNKNRGSSNTNTISIRNLPISKPILTPTFSLHSRGQASDEEPLTPRYPPPHPPSFSSQHSRHGSRQHHGPTASVSSIATTSTMNRRTPELTATATTIQLAKPPTRQQQTNLGSNNNNNNRKSPDPNARSRTVSPVYPPPQSSQQQQQQQNLSPPASPMRAGSGIPTDDRISNQPPRFNHTPKNSTPTNALPLRSLNTALGMHHPSANTTKVTIVERPTNLSGGGGGPKTAGPAVPYSPYMPFTPVTPITPGLVTKRERKARERHEGRGRKVVMEMVKDEDEVWKGVY
ncbi:MAG: hypothetical protein M1823_004012 [Watsoniomyces obsoletus]|nr:MAG: hypothetical protein M1823_004012 [Watsoniomyces obsoletus]